jgi:ubiquinone biosynthesis protein COQ9
MHDSRPDILSHLLKLVAFEGWTDHALTQAASAAGLSEAQARLVFPHGIKDAVRYFRDASDARLEQLQPQSALAKQRVPDRIRALVLARLDDWLPHREAIRRLTGYALLPQCLPESTAANYRTVDRMWRLAGDQSLDFNFYSKRAILAGVYGSTLLFWLNDRSDGRQDTRDFLARRLENVAGFGRWKQRLLKRFST